MLFLSLSIAPLIPKAPPAIAAIVVAPATVPSPGKKIEPIIAPAITPKEPARRAFFIPLNEENDSLVCE